MKRDKVFKIHFYKIDAGTAPDFQPIKYDIKSTLEAIQKLDFHTYERYLKDEENGDFCCWIDDFSSPQKVRFYKIRRDVQALIELNGNLSELTMPDKAGLAECVHLIFFPDNIVGIEYNYEGPRVEAISDYLYLPRDAQRVRLSVWITFLMTGWSTPHRIQASKQHWRAKKHQRR